MANYYHLPASTVNATAIPVSGRWLAHNKLGMVARGFVANDLFMGTKQLVLPTMTQAARLARVNPTYAWWAAKRLAERTAIEAGEIPLVVPQTNGKALQALPACLDAPVDAWALAKNLVETFGPAVVFDQVIAPAITEPRQQQQQRWRVAVRSRQAPSNNSRRAP